MRLETNREAGSERERFLLETSFSKLAKMIYMYMQSSILQEDFYGYYSIANKEI